MESRVLSHDVVALIHHVELVSSGWHEQLCEQLLLAELASSAEAQPVEVLGTAISKQLGRPIPSATLTTAAQRLVSKHLAVQPATGSLQISQQGRSEVQSRKEASQSLEARVKAVFEALASEYGITTEGGWERFRDACLEPMVGELGARTYQFITGGSSGIAGAKSALAFVEGFPVDIRPRVQELVARFLDPSNEPVRSYLLQHLNGHFLSLAASLTKETLTSLSARLRQNLHLTLFLDTNFLFSVLDLHDNPANDAARELLDLLPRLGARVSFKMYVYPLTIDEARRTLAAYESGLAGIPLTPRLGRAALASHAGVSGVVLRYLRAVAEAKGRMTAHDFLAPYLTDFLATVRAKGVELYNVNTDTLTNSQPVIDDILDQQEFEAARYPDRAKPYEALRHDVTLWHVVKGKRQVKLTSALDAESWIVTVDYRFLGFDSSKGKADPHAPPVCIHPASLLQMLQLWLPRDERLDRALIQGLRAFLPQVFDARAEQSTIKILSSLARYENVDDLPEDTIANVLMSKTLRDRLKSVNEVHAQTELVREMILAEHAETKARLAEEHARAVKLDAEVAAQLKLLEGAREASRSALVTHEASKRELEAEKARLQENLELERSERTGLATRLSSLESELQRQATARELVATARRSRRHLLLFALTLLVALAGASAIGLFAPSGVMQWIEIRPWVAIATAWLVGLGLACVIVWVAGRRLSSIRGSRWFLGLSRVLGFGVVTLWTLALGLASSYLWEKLNHSP